MEFLGFHEWQVAFDLMVSHDEEGNDNGDPIHVVGDDRAVGRGVLPAEDRVEDTPASAAVNFGICVLFGCVSYG